MLVHQRIELGYQCDEVFERLCAALVEFGRQSAAGSSATGGRRCRVERSMWSRRHRTERRFPVPAWGRRLVAQGEGWDGDEGEPS